MTASPETGPSGEDDGYTRDAFCSQFRTSGGYKASFEACFVDLKCLEKHNFSTELFENSRKHHGHSRQFS